MSLDVIHARATKFQSTVFWRNMREYIASAFVAVIFTGYAVTSDNIFVQAGSGLIVAGALFISLYLLFKGRADRDGAASNEDCLDFHRKALIRQRDLLNGVWLWYLAPMVPGLALFTWGVSQGTTLWRATLSTSFMIAVFVGIGLLNSWGARCLQKELDKLSD